MFGKLFDRYDPGYGVSLWVETKNKNPNAQKKK